MDEDLTFPIGQGAKVTVKSYDELESWLRIEQKNWLWLTPKSASVRNDIASNVSNSWQKIINNVGRLNVGSRPLSEALVHLAPLNHDPLLVSTTPSGINVLEIRDTVGERVASFAAGFATSFFNLENVQNREDFMGALLTVFPDLRNATAWSENLRTERANYRRELTNATQKIAKETTEQNRRVEGLVSRGLKAGRRLFKQKRRAWRTAQSNWQADASAAVASIRETENTYKEFMKLKAPVEYWQEKATKHEDNEKKARTRLYWYFPLTLVSMALVFTKVAYFLASHPGAESNKSPIALYFVISGGLLLFSTIVFWIGRLLTKLYLSEHHLRNDAEERAVMTTTYLALTHEGEAKDQDRHIVLAALFRGTPDGIVKDEGPSDASIQGLLTKLLAR